MGDMLVRMATEADAAAVLAIYAPYVENTTITFETEAPSADEFSGRVRATLAGYPYLVGEVDGRIVGYAYAHAQRERAAYRWNAELSLYLSADSVGAGLGSRLFRALLDLLALQNFRNVYGLVTSPNPASVRLHERFGFTLSGVWRRTGYKHGAWHDVMVFEKRIGREEEPPRPILPVDELPAEAVRAALAGGGPRG